MADKPVTREEKYLAYLTGDYTGEIPKPITRKEKYLYELCLKGMGGEISPEEIKAAVNEYLEKNPVKPGATTEQAQQIEQNKKDVDSLKEDLSNKITKFYASNQGETHITDSDNGKIQDMMLYGKSSQDGTPTPENPVEIKSVVNPTVKVTNEDGLKVQSVTLNNINLSATPANTNGNVTIDGQQYIADYIDLEHGKLVKYLYAGKLSDLQYTVRPAEDPKWYDASISNSFELISIKYKGIAFKDGSLTVGFCNKAKTYGFAGFYGKTVECGVMNSNGYIVVNLPISLGINTVDLFREWSKECYIIKEFNTPIESNLTAEEIEAFKELSAYYPITNISVTSDQLDGYTVFNYPISMANGWNYVKQQLNDNRDYIYDMDLQSAEAYVNSEYAVALTELEV